MERNQGLWKLLRHPIAYEAMQIVCGADRMLRILLDDYIRPIPGDRVLDLGCGTARIATRMRDVQYVGIDSNAEYVRYGAARLVQGGKVVHGDFSLAAQLEPSSFDIVLAIGLIHHLTDAETTSLFQLTARNLKPGGKLVTIDPCIEEDQNPLVSAIIGFDRGRNVRDQTQYEAMAGRVFKNVRSFLRHDTLYYPYAHCVLEASESIDKSG